MLHASQVSVGEENALSIRVYGEKGGLEWRQQEPNSLWLKWPDRPAEMLRTGGGYLSELAVANTRHRRSDIPRATWKPSPISTRPLPERFAPCEAGQHPCARGRLPGIEEAIRGMAFIELAVAASASNTKWHAWNNANTRGRHMSKMKGPAIFLAQFISQEAPFDSGKHKPLGRGTGLQGRADSYLGSRA